VELNGHIFKTGTNVLVQSDISLCSYMVNTKEMEDETLWIMNYTDQDDQHYEAMQTCVKLVTEHLTDSCCAQLKYISELCKSLIYSCAQWSDFVM